MPRRAWNSESMNELINDLGGELVSMFVPPDSWALTVYGMDEEAVHHTEGDWC